jgi:hypothetical protein
MNAGPSPTTASARSSAAAMPASRTSCMVIAVIPCSACQENSSGPGQ